MLKALQIEASTIYSTLTDAQRTLLMHGTGDRRKELGFKFDGVIPSLRVRYNETESDAVKERLHAYMSSAKCEACDGARLRKEALGVKLQSGALSLSISDVAALTVTRALGFVSTLALTKEQQAIAAPIVASSWEVWSTRKPWAPQSRAS